MQGKKKKKVFGGVSLTNNDLHRKICPGLARRTDRFNLSNFSDLKE